MTVTKQAIDAQLLAAAKMTGASDRYRIWLCKRFGLWSMDCDTLTMAEEAAMIRRYIERDSLADVKAVNGQTYAQAVALAYPS